MNKCQKISSSIKQDLELISLPEDISSLCMIYKRILAYISIIDNNILVNVYEHERPISELIALGINTGQCKEALRLLNKIKSEEDKQASYQLLVMEVNRINLEANFNKHNTNK